MNSIDDTFPKVSVVVSTWNRAPLLPRLVDALCKQSLPANEFEFIVVDNASNDETPIILENLASRTPFMMRVMSMQVNKGPGRARSLGAKAARAPIIAFTDDDCVPAPNWLTSGLQMASTGRIVVGRTEPNPSQPHGPFSRTLRVNTTQFMQTCNVFYAREQFLQCGGFDPAFQRGGEDTDLGLRLQKQGAEAVFCHDALVRHDVRPSSFASAFKEAATKWTDLPLVVKRHPEVRRWLTAGVFWKRSHAHLSLAISALLFCWFSPWLLIGTIPWLRYRLLRVPLDERFGVRLVTLPGALAIDSVEMGAMIYGSLRHRAILL